ncbi:hypothetical protein LCGC14_0937840 [marine sediment metagenome]|uniref:Uncharacterized protein n=1 Tax=marine sediment metagenome TaxID=412755 RepID=A0A0F9RS95_9ZZZZ
MKHKHIEGLSIELQTPTNKGWKVKKTEIFAPGRKLRTPKTKVAYYTNSELKELFS